MQGGNPIKQETPPRECGVPDAIADEGKKKGSPRGNIYLKILMESRLRTSRRKMLTLESGH